MNELKSPPRLTRAIATSPLAISAAAAVLGAATFCLWFPGLLNNDSAAQYAQAVTGHIDDWQPPIMARLWMLAGTSRGVWPLFALNTALYWTGFALICHALVKSGRLVLAWVVLASAASPLFAFFNREIITDVGLASALIAAFGLTFWCRVRFGRVPVFVLPIVFVIIAYSALVRTNAAFAATPVLLYLLGIPARPASAKWIGACLAVTAVALPLTMGVNRLVLKATDSGAVQRLQLYDLVGIAVRSGDQSAVRTLVGVPPEPLDRCYSTVLWDTLLKAPCDLWNRLPPPSSAGRSEVGRLWVETILRHPVAYAVHRLEHFNAETFFMVPVAPQCVSAPQLHDCGTASSGHQRVLGSVSLTWSDYLLKNPLVWPITWLAAALASIFVRRDRVTDINTAAKILLSSSLIYGFAYLLVGIAMNVRYFYWTILAAQIGIILTYAELSREQRKRFVWSVGIPVVCTMLIGYLFRSANISLLIS